MTTLAALSPWTEAEFQRNIVKLAVDFGWHIGAKDLREQQEQHDALGLGPVVLPGLVFHPRVMYRSEPGWPDLTLIRRRDRRLIFAELKTDKKTSQLSDRQAQVLELLRCLETPPIAVVSLPVDVTPELASLIRAGIAAVRGPLVQVFVWRPADLETIARVLQ